jgi:signal transduction histidine kinase
MTEDRERADPEAVKLQKLNLAFVGGGQACKFFLELFDNNPFPYLTVNVLAVCDVDPEAVGVRLAREKGIFTTQKYEDILKIEGLDGVLELTDDRDVLLDMIRLRPKGLSVFDHNLGRLLKNLFDVSQRLRMTEQEVELERAISELLLHQTNESIVLLDPDYTILDANVGYLRGVRRSREEAIGNPCYEVVYGFNSPCSEWQPEMECPMLDTLRTGERAQVIHEQLDEEGNTTYCNLETYPVKGKGGDVARVIEIRRDISQELPSRWEMRLKELKSDLGKLVQEDRILSLGKLSASCAHEINNPIQGLLTFAHLMKTILSEKKPSKEDLKEFDGHLTLMCKELERCGNIVSGLLSFARESPMETREVELNEILQSVITLTGHHLKLNDITLSLELSEEPLNVRGDLNQLQQCFLNVFFNAIEATKERGELGIISRYSPDGTYAEVLIKDTGCGIPAGNMDKIFDPFFTTKPEGEGTGLGLSIVYGIVRAHEGQIKVDSEPGKGTTVSLVFPAFSLSDKGEPFDE